MPKTYLMVRSVVSDAALRDKFDRWYSTEHLAWAIDVLKAEKGWRFWSKVDASVHVAVYQFAEGRDVEAALKSDGFKELAADYDRTWPVGVTRTRDILNLVEERDAVLGSEGGQRRGTRRAHTCDRAARKEPPRGPASLRSASPTLHSGRGARGRGTVRTQGCCTPE